MASFQQDFQSSSIILDESGFDTSIIIGVVIVTLIVIVVMSITMNIWMRYRSMLAMESLRKSSFIKNKSVLPTVSLTKPSPTFNKEAKLPVYYRRSDTWESYLKMIQTPDKLNDVVHSMKVSHTPSSSISTKIGAPSDSIDGNAYFINTKVSHSPSGSIDNTYSHSPSGSIDNTYSHSPSGSIDNTYSHSPSGSIDNIYGHLPSGSIDNTYGHSPSGSIDNTCYTSNDHKLYRQSSLSKEYDDNNN